MIAAIEWIPAGRANPTPSKYEYSRAEQAFLEKVQAGEHEENEEENEEEIRKNITIATQNKEKLEDINNIISKLVKNELDYKTTLNKYKQDIIEKYKDIRSIEERNMDGWKV